MALPSSGAISMSQVRTELGRSGAISLNDGTVRALAGKASGTISMADLRGKSITPGTPYGGGFYAGKIMVAGQAYALVVAPKAQGDAGSLQWKTTNTTTAGTDSRNDGWANTQAMIQAGSADHPAAAFCRGLNINGYNDWYLPSQDELEILYRAFKPTTEDNITSGGTGTNPSAIPPTGSYTTSNPSQTGVSAFKAGGGEDFAADWHWSSTSSGTLASSSWRSYFGNGNQSTNVKRSTYLVRAVRRVAI